MIRINGIDKPSTINEQSSVPHGTYHLADNPNLFEIQRTNNFEFVVTDIDGIVRAGMTERDFNGVIPNAQEIIRLSMIGTFVPHFTQGVITVKRGNSELRYAGVPEFNSGGSITVNDFIGADTKSVLMAWQNLSYNVRTEKVGLISDYKKDCYVIEYSPDMQIVRQWKLHGCWISGISENDYNAESNDKHQITATIQYDRAEIDTSSLL